MTPEQHRAAALRLDEAERTRRQIRMISLEHPDMTMADAYAVQGAWRDGQARARASASSATRSG